MDRPPYWSMTACGTPAWCRTGALRTIIGAGPVRHRINSARPDFRCSGPSLTPRPYPVFSVSLLVLSLLVQTARSSDHPLRDMTLRSAGWLTSRLGAVERLPLPLPDVLPLLKLPDEFLGPGTEVVCRDSGLFPGHQCRLDYLEQQLQV